MRKCPICSLLDGKFINGENFCDNCKNTFDVINKYRRYSIYRSVLFMIRASYFAYPVLMIVQFYFLWSHDVGIANWVMALFGCALCTYNICRWLYVDKVPFWGKWDKLEGLKEKLFVAKLAGIRNGVED